MPAPKSKRLITMHLISLQRKYKIETEVENWIQKFDGDMGERQVHFYIFHDIPVNKQS